MHDLVLRNATIVDGTGAPRHRGDVAIDGDRIAAVTAPGAIAPGAKNARAELDADGLVAAPGFIDVHTHYDCQLFWDPTASPSSWHGVTSVVMGNCGFTIAPCRPEHREKVMQLLLYVEGMPIETLRAGIQWSWEDFPGYLDAIERQGVGPNVAAFVGLSAVRFAVMGLAAVERPASADERSAMQEVVRGAMRAGAIGWSTSLSPTHFFGDGTPAPTRFSDEDELRAMARVSAEFRHGLIEVAPESTLGGEEDKLRDLERFADLARVSGKTVTFAPLLHNQFLPAVARHVIEAAGVLQGQGAHVLPQVGCRPLELRFDFAVPGFGLENNGYWRQILHEPIGARRERFASREFRDELKGYDRNFMALLTPGWDRMFLRVPALDRNAAWRDRSLEEIAAATGKHPVDAMLDLALDEDLRGQWGVTMLNSDEQGVRELISHPAGQIALSDAGAHVDTLCDQGFTSYLLGHWVRERGALELEDAVRRVTSRPADLYGLTGRGRLRPGAFADVVLFDPQRINQKPTEVVADLPGGQKRLLQRAEGIPFVFVNGRRVIDDGVPTGDLAGQVLRSFAG